VPHHEAVEVVGRDAELGQITARVLDPGALPARCLLTGEAGSGKTTVWRAIVDEARRRGLRVLAASAAEAEWQLSLSAARDLIDDALDDIEGDLPAPQLRLLRVLLLLEDPGERSADPGALAVAFLGLIRAAAARGPVLIAVDDIQWLDPASAALLSYALRRLTAEPVGVLIALRNGPGEASDALTSDLTRQASAVHLGPLTLGAIGAVLRDHLAVSVSRPTLRQIHETSAGNPLFAIELARVVSDPARPRPPGAPLLVPASLADLLRARLEGIDRAALGTLGVLAATASASMPADMLASLLGHDPGGELAAASDAGVVDVTQDGVRFRHPLLASLAYDLLGPARQREIHRRLGELLADTEERAHHLALGVDGPDPEAAAIVESGARIAFARGSPSAAADLAFHAGRLTPAADRPALHRRALVEVDAAFAAGETTRAAERLDSFLAAVEPGRDRAELLARRARLHSFADDIGASIDGLEEALREAGDDDALRGRIEEGLAWGKMLVRRDLAGALALARSAVVLARATDDTVALAEALATQALAECLTGEPWLATIEAGLALEPTLGTLPATRRPGFAHGCCLTCVGDLEGARAAFEGLVAHATANGDEALLPSILNRLARVELQAGRWDAAAALVDDGLERATDSGHSPSIASLLGKRAVLAAWRGDHDRARGDAERALDLILGPAHGPADAERAVARGGESPLWALGHVALAEGRPEAAVELLEPMTNVLIEAGVIEPGEMPWLADLVEASVLAGRIDAAERLVGLFDRVAGVAGRGADAALADYLRALLETANGDHPAARARLQAAGPRQRDLGRRFEAARTDLAMGGVQRRLRERRAARDTLERSRADFDALGALAWASRATAELGRIGGRAPAGDGLTPTERAVAVLVAQGRTNREAAAALFLSVHTVEAALTAVYGKLGVRSRTELARQIDAIDEGNS
jgi:DNA-binding CsgD family transcriptional regulator